MALLASGVRLVDVGERQSGNCPFLEKAIFPSRRPPLHSLSRLSGASFASIHPRSSDELAFPAASFLNRPASCENLLAGRKLCIFKNNQAFLQHQLHFGGDLATPTKIIPEREAMRSSKSLVALEAALDDLGSGGRGCSCAGGGGCCADCISAMFFFSTSAMNCAEFKLSSSESSSERL